MTSLRDGCSYFSGGLGRTPWETVRVDQTVKITGDRAKMRETPRENPGELTGLLYCSFSRVSTFPQPKS